MLALINKKTNKELVASIGKILISMLILSSLIEIDASRKFIYINPSYIESLRMFPKYRSLAYL